MSLPVSAELDERAASIVNSQAKVSVGMGNSQIPAPAATSAQFAVAQLDTGAASVNVSSPVQDATATFRGYAQPENPAYNKTPDPPVSLLVLIGLLGLLIGRRRFR